MIAHGFSWIAGVIISTISGIGYPGIIFLMGLSSACIPIPSEIILPFSGYLVSLGRFQFTSAVASGVTGDILGSMAIYWMGKLGGEALLTRYGGFFFLRASRVAEAEIFYRRYGTLSVFLGKMVPFLRTFISLPAGLFAMAFSAFLLSTFAGGFLWSFMLILLGFLLGKNWSLIGLYFHRFELFFFFCLIAGIFYWLGKKLF